jgi:type II secretory pathway component GspD/PulD (secretin)
VISLLAIVTAFGVLPGWKPIKTSEVRVTCVRLHEAADVLNQVKSERGQIVVNYRRQTIRVTDVAWDVDRMLQIVRAIQRPAAQDQRVWFAHVQWGLASEMAAKLKELFTGAEWLPGESISAIIPDDRGKQLIIVANDRGYERIRRIICCPDISLDREYERVDGPIELP